MNPNVSAPDQFHHGDTDRHGGIEGTSRNAANRKGHHANGESNRESVIRIATRGLSRCDVEHDPGQCECAEKFHKQRGADFEFARC